MEGLKLGAREQQYYAELFQACDAEGSGKVTGLKASELFLSSGLSPDVLKQITELCGAKRLGHFGRSQFYIALKLVALAQAGIPIKLDALNSGKDIPLPKFSSKGSEQVRCVLSDRKKSSGEPDSVASESKTNAQLSGQLPPPPVSKKSHSRSLSGQYRGIVPDQAVVVSSQSSQFSSQMGVKDDSPHNSKSPPFSPTESPPTSPANQKLLLKQNTAPAAVFANSVTNVSSVGAPGVAHVAMSGSLDSADATQHLVNPSLLTGDGGHVNPVALSDGSVVTKSHVTVSSVGGIQAHAGQIQQPGVQSQHHQPPGQENGNWTMFEDDESHMLLGSGVKEHYSTLDPPNFDSSSISSETESVDDVWTITDEQREYYVNQFKTMQPDLSAAITGPVAKHFFEKSKLPVVELSKIWQLSDLNCDGALSLEEFCIAMHLVVLRRNDIELPEHLPLSLMPYSTLASDIMRWGEACSSTPVDMTDNDDEPFAADLPPGSTLKRATPPSPQQIVAQWTAFASESPDSGGLHSPAHLANFEFAKPSADPELKIVQPVPVHVLPDGRPLPSDVCDRGRAFSDPAVLYEQVRGQELGEVTPPLTKQRANTESQFHDSSQLEASNKYSTPIHGRPRPVPPKKNSSGTETFVPAVIRGQLQPPPGSSLDGSAAGGATERPNDISGQFQSHAPPTPPPRPPHGRSMSVDVKSSSQLIAPAVPPRVSPKETQAAPAILPTDFLPDVNQTLPAAAVDKDLADDDDVAEKPHSKPALAVRQGSRDRRDIQIAVRTHRERNTMLTRLNSELNQELQEVMEQRIALEIQLEHLRPFSS